MIQCEERFPIMHNSVYNLYPQESLKSRSGCLLQYFSRIDFNWVNGRPHAHTVVYPSRIWRLNLSPCIEHVLRWAIIFGADVQKLLADCLCWASWRWTDQFFWWPGREKRYRHLCWAAWKDRQFLLVDSQKRTFNKWSCLDSHKKRENSVFFMGRWNIFSGLVVQFL